MKDLPAHSDASSQPHEDLGHHYYQRYLNHLHGVKQSFLGYPCSPFTDENRQSILHTIAPVTINNVGDPYDETGHWKTHSKRFEREVIDFFAHLFDFGHTSPSVNAAVGEEDNDVDGDGLLKSERINISPLESIIAADGESSGNEANKSIHSTNCWGYVTSGGTEGNLQGMYLGRNYLRHRHREESKRPLPIVFIASKSSHYSIKKNADILDMDYYEIRVNDKDEIDMEHLKEVLQSLPADQGIVFNLNIGTTMKGAIDPVEDIVAFIDATNRSDYVYFHADMALYGLVYRFFHSYDSRVFKYRVHSFAISGHKLLTCPMPCGIFLVKSSFLNTAFHHATNDHHSANIERISYIGCHDNTISGSRNGMLPLLIHGKIIRGVKYLKEEIKNCIDNANFLYDELRRRKKQVGRSSEAGLIVYFPSPSELVCDKYQLACSEGLSHIVCMPHVTRHMILQFLQDYQSHDVSIGFRVVGEMEVDKCAHCVAVNFVDREALTIFQNINYDEFMPFITPLVRKGMGTSIVAYDTRISDLQDNVIGCCIAIDQEEEENGNADLSEKFAPIMNILEEVHNLSTENDDNCDDIAKKVTSKHAFGQRKKVLHLCNVAVDSIYAGKGFASLLIEKTIELAQQLAYEEIVVETTAAGSLKACLKAGFEVQRSIPVHTYTYIDEDSEKLVCPFKSLEEQNLTVTYLIKKLKSTN